MAPATMELYEHEWAASKLWDVVFPKDFEGAPQDLGRWVWTPLASLRAVDNEDLTVDLLPWILQGIELEQPEEIDDV